MSSTIAAFILARDEEGIIRSCLERLTWCDEVHVILDPGSSDGTREILRSLSVHVVDNPFASFAAQRNWALQTLGHRCDWALMLDADELVTKDFAMEIRAKIETVPPHVNAFAICRKTMFLGAWMRYSDCFPVWIMRVVRPTVRFEDSGHGEVPIPIDASAVARIESPIEHFPFYKGIENWLTKHNAYSSREADKEARSPEPTRWWNVLTFDTSVRRNALRRLASNTLLRPFLRFVYQYFFRLGFLEGRRGLMYCMLMASYEAFIQVKREEKKENARSKLLAEGACQDD